MYPLYNKLHCAVNGHNILKDHNIVDDNVHHMTHDMVAAFRDPGRIAELLQCISCTTAVQDFNEPHQSAHTLLHWKCTGKITPESQNSSACPAPINNDRP